MCLASVGLVWYVQPAAAQAKQDKIVRQQARQAAKQAKQKGPVPAEQLQRLLDMTPEEREKALADLPPARRRVIENRLNRLDDLTPQQRERRLNLARRLESLPRERQAAVRQELQALRAMTFAERRARLHSSEFDQTYSPAEQQLIRDQYAGAAR